MSIPAGPQQIANVYQGNPGALQANIQKDQQQKPNLTPDFAKLLALGTVTSEKDDAAKAQALQQLQGLVAQSPTGKPPTVFEQVQAKAAQMAMMRGQQAQPQAQGLPAAMQSQQAQAPQAQGIDQIPSNLQLAGGGIVAFNEGGDKGKKKKDESDLYPYNMPDADIYGDAGPPEDVKKALAYTFGAPLAAAGDALASPINAIRNLTTHGGVSMTPLSDARARYLGLDKQNAEAPATAPAATPATARPTPQQIERMAAQQAAPVRAPAPKPAPAGLAQLASQAAPAADTSDHNYLMQHVKRTLEQNPEAIGEAAAARNRKMLGIDELLAEKNQRIAEREALLKQQQAGRLPSWVTQAAAFAAANPRAGLGAQLGASGLAAQKQREAYEEQDLAFNAEINKLKDAVLQAKIEGRYKDAAAYEAALNRVRQEQTSALSSGTSLENAAEARKSREATAKENAARAAREAQYRREDKAERLTQEQEQNQRNLALKQATAAARAEMALPQNMARFRGMTEEEVALQKFPRFLAALKGDKMTEAPGASSPGGTTRMRFDAKGNPI